MTFVLGAPRAARPSPDHAALAGRSGETLRIAPNAVLRPVPAVSDAVSVLVADDNDVYRGGVVRALTRRCIDVVAEVADGARALDEIRRLRPRVALLDLRMPHLDGIDVAEQVRADPSLVGVRVVILSAEDRGAAIVRAREAGVVAYLDKDATRRDICDAVLAAADGPQR
jgi:two-component system nitrate/nitrite response regulator NarL